uniref:Ig-like domain-containing protein n=1 Tax=Hippocampus comes TaxID=109280 RepID=A0A3Q3DX99_HIPCM
SSPDSRKTKAKLDWVNKIAAEDPDLWERELRGSINNEQWSKVNIEIAKEHARHCVHMLQWMIGCEWDDETGEVDGWKQYSYDGEDFISFEWKTMRWIAANPQAFISKNKWERLDGLKEYWKSYVTEICPAALKKYVSIGRDFLMRTGAVASHTLVVSAVLFICPSSSHALKTPSSPVTCHATGFYPRTSDLFWRKDGEQLHEDVEMGQTLPNHDGTFQTAVHLKVEAAPDAEAKYECVFRLAGVEEAIVVKLDGKSILSNMVVAIAVTLGVLALLAAGGAAVPAHSCPKVRDAKIFSAVKIQRELAPLVAKSPSS